MKYCPRCVVEVEDRLRYCPLCDEELQQELPDVHGEYPDFVPPEETIAPVPKGVKRTWTLVGIAIGGLVAMMICTIVDLNMGGGLDWSWYVNVSIPGLLGILGICLYLAGRPILLFLGVWLVTAALTVSIDAISKTLSWSVTIGLPICASALILFGSWLYVVLRNRVRATPAIVSMLGVIALFCLSIDYLVNVSPSQSPKISWSLPVLISLSAIGVGLLVAIQALKKNQRWSRFFER